MRLSIDLQKRLGEEFRFAADQMAKAPDLMTKLYFFSAFYGEAQRVLNQQWDADLALLHLVLASTHAAISQRTTAVVAGADRVVRIPAEFPDALTKAANDLAILFEKEKVSTDSLSKILARLAELAYLTHGNGYYLYVKGKIKI